MAASLEMSQKKGEEFVIVKGYLPLSLKIQFKVLCTQKQLTMSSVLEDLIEKWIKADAPVPNSTIDLSHQEVQQVKGYVPKSLKLKFQRICTQKQIKMGFVMHNLINEWVLSGGSPNNRLAQ